MWRQLLMNGWVWKGRHDGMIMAGKFRTTRRTCPSVRRKGRIIIGKIVQHLEEGVNSNGVGFLYKIHYSIYWLRLVKIRTFSEVCRYSDLAMDWTIMGSNLSGENYVYLLRKGHTSSGILPDSYSTGTGVLFWRIMRPEREFDHTPHSRTEI